MSSLSLPGHRRLPLVLWVRRIGALAVIGSTLAVGGSVAGTLLTQADKAPLPAATTAPDPSVANIWIQNGGGTCAGGRSATPILLSAASSPDRICGTFDAAWDAMSNGDTARCVASATYAGQTITGNKTAPTFISCDDGTELTDTIQVDGNFVNVENILVDVGCQEAQGTGSGAQVNGDNVTFADVSLWGCHTTLETGPEGNGGDNFTWTGGEFGEPGVAPDPRDASDGEPIWLNGDGATIDNIVIAPQQAEGGFHLEHIRVQAAQNVTISRNVFGDGADVGSGYIFITSSTSSSTAANNLHLIGNVFGVGVDGSFTIQVHANVQNSNGWVFAYNTFRVPTVASPGDILLHDGSEAAIVWVGNLGPKTGGGCSGTWIKNVWQNNTNTACGTDTWVSGPQEGVGNLGINADLIHLNSGSPAINAGEAAGASDYCTDSAVVASRDYDGDPRPAGAACDAGADERE